MAFIVDISTTKLRSGDQITFTVTGGTSAGTYTITVIPSINQPSTLEVKSTDDIVPSSNEWQTAVQRLSNAINIIGGVTSVTSANTVITVQFESAVTNAAVAVTNAAGSLINVVKTINNGTVTNIDPVLIPNIRVSSITHTLQEYNYTSLSYPHGNMSDKLETVISFQSADTFSVLDFYYGWVDNETVIYPSAGSGIYAINKDLFQDITTGTEQKFTGDTTQINAVAPLQGNKVESIVLVNTGGNNYTLTIVHYIPILPRPIDVSDDNTLNKPAEINTSIKFIFQIDLKQDLITPNPTETTAKQNLTEFISDGNIGYVGEVYQTGQLFYTLGGFTWNNADNELNSGLNTTGLIEINKTGAFDANHDVVLKIQEITDSFNESLTQIQNYSFDSVQVKTNNVSASSTILKNVSADFSGTTALINFEVEAGKILDNYVVWVSLADGTTNKNNQNVLAKIGDAISVADESTVIFGTYPSAPRAEYNYNLHYLDDIANSFNEVKSYIDDYVLSRFRVQNNDTTNNTLQSFILRLRSGNNIIETYTINATDLTAGTFEIERDFNLLDTDLRKKITVIDNGNGTYDFTYPFQVTSNMVGADNVVQETITNFVQVTAVGEVAFTNNFISPTFDLGNYDLSKNSVSDPQVTLPPSNIKYFDETGTNEVGVILNSGKTLIVATFEEDNLNDFVADPTAPFFYPDNTPLSNYLTAYFGLNDNNNAQSNYFRFHNLRDNEQSPFEQVSSLGSNYYARLDRVDIDTATLKALIDADAIKEVYGEDFECLKVTARLDKIQDGSLPPVQCIIILQTDVDNLTNVSAEITPGTNSQWKYKGATVVLGDTINQIIGTADGTLQDVEYLTDDCTTLTDVTAQGPEWVGSIDLSQLTAVERIILGGQNNGTKQTSITFPTGNTNPITFLDLQESDFVSIDLTGVNIGGVLEVAESTQVSPINPLNSLILPLNNNNIWSLFQVINSQITTLDLSQQNNLGGQLRLLSNSLLTSLTLGSSSEVFSSIGVFGNSALTGNLDLSGYPNVLNIDIKDNNLDSVTFANATSVVNGINGNNNNFTAIDFTNLANNFSGDIRFENNNISSLTIPSNSQTITRFDFTNNNLSSIDLSMLTGLGGIIQLDNNSFTSQSNFNFGTLTNVTTNFKIDANNISGVWDFTTFANTNVFSGVIDLRNNSITEIIYQNSSLTISFNYGANNNINTPLDLTPLTGSAGELDFQNNSIPSVTLPSSSNVINRLRFNNNNIVNFDITPLTGVNNSILIRLNNNDMTTLSMDNLISDLDSKGWINGQLFLNAQSTTQQPTTTATAYINLLGKGWSITI